MDLIERYVLEVGRRLPRNQREDVQNELRSLLQDMVEDRAQTKYEKAEEDEIVSVLLEFGNPKDVAASYKQDKQYLIGPQLFPIFKIVVTVVTAVLGGVVLLGITLSVRSSDAFLQDWVTTIFKGIPDFLDSWLRSLTIITIIFAVLERTLPEEAFDEESYEDDESWDPRKLPASDQKKKIGRGELIFGIAFSLFIFILLNFYPQRAGIYYFENDAFVVLLSLSENFYNNLLPWLNALLIISIVVDGYKLYTGKKTRLVQMLDLGVTLLTAGVVYILMTGGPIFGVNDALAAAGDSNAIANSELVSVLSDTFNTLLGLGLPVAFVILLLSAVKKSYDLWHMPLVHHVNLVKK